MEKNIDEAILISKRVDENDAQPVLSQVLRIAVYEEFRAYETYSAIIDKFGLINPFVNIKEAEAMHYTALVTLMQKYQIEVPFNDWAGKIAVPNSVIECCELGVAAEIDNISMYDHLLLYVNEPDVQDVLYQLQAASFNNHLPAFRNCVLNHYTASPQQNVMGFNPDTMMQKAEEYQMMLQELASGELDQDKITQLLSKMNISMISGAAFGAAGVAFMNSYMNQDKE